ncbi:MAG: hypothetical protein ACOY4L_05670 [Pseudomonadota bacterium]
MKKRAPLIDALLTLGTALPALADRNSKFGEDTALDPRGIHDARFDSWASGIDDPFMSG